jgi:hypothetical protein
VTRSVKEHNLAAKGRRVFLGDLHFVRADVLRDSASFATGDVGLANRIQQ